ncbi:hypothetical protein SCYAM73S_04742 [Streptomyces cyaneofuscatus]
MGSAVITARAAATFEPVGRSVATARAFVRDTLQGWGYNDVVDDAVVLTSELVTNAVVHAGTAADVLCLRTEDGVRVEVADHYPEREVPLQSNGLDFGSPDRENGRGLLLCAALASRWGVEYTPTRKHVWFQLDLPERPVGIRSAGPLLPTALLPVADQRVRVAVVQIDHSGSIAAWNDDAAFLFGHGADEVAGKQLTDFVAWPHTPGTNTGIADALRLSRWEGSYGIRCADGRVTPVYASHLRVRDTDGEPSTVCLLVRDYERAVLQSPVRAPVSDSSSENRSADPFEVFIGSPAPDDLDGLLQRTVERARDMLDADAAFLLLATDDETVVLPLVARNRVIGMLTLGKPSDDHFRQEILELAEDLSRRAALALDNARLYSERMAISQSLQRSLLPPGLPDVPNVEIEVIYRAAGEGNEVGGDFYDVFPIHDGAYGFAIGDVCGTGPEAAAVTGLARHALRLLAKEGFPGPAVLERLNAAILDEGARSRFLTLLYGELWPQEDGSALLKVVCAGHPLPLRLRQDGSVESAAEPQPLLGVLEDLELYEQEVTLNPGDVLLCVTDGVTERREGTRMLGDDGLADVLSTCTGLTAGAVAARILRAVERFAAEPASDDMAILAMRVPEPPRA